MMFSESGEKKKVFDKIRFLERNKRLKHYLECSFVVLTGEVKDFDSIQKHYAEYNHQTKILELNFFGKEVLYQSLNEVFVKAMMIAIKNPEDFKIKVLSFFEINQDNSEMLFSYLMAEYKLQNWEVC